MSDNPTNWILSVADANLGARTVAAKLVPKPMWFVKSYEKKFVSLFGLPLTENMATKLAE